MPIALPMHPGLEPYRALFQELGDSATDAWIARADRHARRRDLRSATGRPLRFVAAAGAVAGALDYESRIHEQGEIACRVDGAGARHDLHNALVWLRWPRTKARLNALHVSAALAPTRANRRSPLRDALTLFDESGAVWFGDGGPLDACLRARDWTGLFVTRRAEVSSLRVVVFGHGLLEKLHRPYKAMTAHALMLPSRAPASAGGAVPEGVATDGASDDAFLAGQLARWAASAGQAGGEGGGRPPLAPLPVQGLPGWDDANEDPSYYADETVFRRRPSPETGRRAESGANHEAS